MTSQLLQIGEVAERVGLLLRTVRSYADQLTRAESFAKQLRRQTRRRSSPTGARS